MAPFPSSECFFAPSLVPHRWANPHARIQHTHSHTKTPPIPALAQQGALTPTDTHPPLHQDAHSHTRKHTCEMCINTLTQSHSQRHTLRHTRRHRCWSIPVTRAPPTPGGHIPVLAKLYAEVLPSSAQSNSTCRFPRQFSCQRMPPVRSQSWAPIPCPSPSGQDFMAPVLTPQPWCLLELW